MTEWLKALGGIKDPALLLLGLVVLALLYLGFRLLQSVVSATTDQTANAIKNLAEEIKGLSRDTTRMVVCVDAMMRHQEQCINRPAARKSGEAQE